jgi:hypothetical protein
VAEKGLLQPGWIKLDELYDFLLLCDVSESRRGCRDNYTDGEFHAFFIHGESKQVFECKANLYDSLSFNDLIKWAKQKGS